MSTGRMTSTISVIIPALNEAAHIGATLNQLRDAAGVEAIVVDGGSRDQTVKEAARRGARVLKTAPGRAGQMNAGAAAAAGDTLLFLHADTLLPPGFAGPVRAVLARRGVAAGAFSLGIGAPGAAFRLVEWAANWRARIFSLPYGDQAIFFTREVFQAVGGFPDQPLMEDFALARALRQRGRVVILPWTARTSARRWRRLGVLRTTCLNQAIVLAYLLGVSPARLAAWYHGRRGG